MLTGLMSSEFITQRGNSGTPSLLKLLFLARFARSLLAAGFFSKGHRLVIANAKVRYGGGRVEKKARQGWYGRGGRRRVMSRPIPLLPKRLAS